MTVRFSLFVATLAILVSFPASAIAQSKNESSFFVRTNVLVTDDAKNYVNDLTKDDFSLTENGVVQPITHFAKRQGPLNIAIVVDNTGSMRLYLERIISIGKQITVNLGKGDEAKLVRFVDSDSIKVIQDWSTDHDRLRLMFEQLFVEGGQSAIVDGVYAAAADIVTRYDSDKDRRYAIILISDMEDRASLKSQEDLLKLLNGRDIPIISFALTGLFESSGTRKKLEGWSNYLSMSTGGASYPFDLNPTKEDLQTAVKAAIYEIRSQFIIGYEAKDVKKKSANRTIRITAKDGTKGEKRTVTSKANILLPVD